MIFCFSTPPASSSDELDTERQQQDEEDEDKSEISEESECEDDTQLEKDDFEALQEGKL